MTKYYLIDFENVSDAGLYGMSSLSSEDYVILFYSPQVLRINLDDFQNFSGHFRVVKTEAGNQALDKSLLSCLGYFLGRNDPNDSEYYIISKDNGFASFPAFWSNLLGSDCKIFVQPTISGEQCPVSQSNSPDAKSKKPSTGNSPKSKAAKNTKVSPNDYTVLNNKIMQAMKEIAKNRTDSGAIAAIVIKAAKSGTSKSETYRTIISTFGQKNGLLYYTAIKKLF